MNPQDDINMMPEFCKEEFLKVPIYVPVPSDTRASVRKTLLIMPDGTARIVEPSR